MTVTQVDTQADTQNHDDTYVSAVDRRPPTPTHRHRQDTEPCTIDSNGELDDVKWWSSIPLRAWETQRLDADNSQHVPDKTQTLHVILIRHAESYNNALTDKFFDKLHVAARKHTQRYSGDEKTTDDGQSHSDTSSKSSAAADKHADHDKLMDQYNLQRSADPDLSELGYKQAAALPRHPYLADIRLPVLAQQQRVKFVCSPMRRAMLTSAPLLKQLHMRATVNVEWTERGGAFESKTNPETGKVENLSVIGRGRDEMQAEFKKTHDCAAVPAEGWWKQHTDISPHVEEDPLFYVRLERVVKWLKHEATQYALHYRKSIMDDAANTEPDFLVVMCHADLIDELLSRLLGCTQRRYVFYTTNTAIAHVELLYMGNDKMEARVRGTNIQPAKVA